MVVRWRSTPLDPDEVPDGLDWTVEEARAGYRCPLAFGTDDTGRTFRRVTFPGGGHIYSQLDYLGEVPAHVA